MIDLITVNSRVNFPDGKNDNENQKDKNFGKVGRKSALFMWFNSGGNATCLIYQYSGQFSGQI